MCGIVGYIGYKEATDVIIKGLKSLEYRGYDSSGLSIIDNSKIYTLKTKGRIDDLVKMMENSDIKGKIGIGHTRWATHGKPSNINAHPHTDCKKRFSLVHNGIIENFNDLKNDLLKKGHIFSSETDTEVIVHLIEEYFETNTITTIVKLQSMLVGSFALAILDKENPNQIVAVRKDSPLVIGLGENENFIASDIPALLSYTNDFFIMEDGEIAVISNDQVKIMDKLGGLVNKKIFKAKWNVQEVNKCGYEDYMLKEIYEQPDAIRKTLEAYLDVNELKLPFAFSNDDINDITRITIIGCGTASYAGKVGEFILEELTHIPTKVEVGSEYRYKKPIINNKNLVIVLSQSGETADTLASMREALKCGAKVIGVTNVVGSTLSRELENVIHTYAGPEIAVASTKAFTTQIISLYLIGLYISKVKGNISNVTYDSYINILRTLPGNIEKIFTVSEKIQNVADSFYNSENIFFVGRLSDYPISLEGSHKLKEISYIHSEAYEAGELKHGALALITKGVPVVCLSTISSISTKMKSNIAEIQARNASIIQFRCEGIPSDENIEYDIVIPSVGDLFQPILSVIPLQLLSYYVAKKRNCDVDKPRNLAKSVTVE